VARVQTVATAVAVGAASAALPTMHRMNTGRTLPAQVHLEAARCVAWLGAEWLEYVDRVLQRLGQRRAQRALGAFLCRNRVGFRHLAATKMRRRASTSPHVLSPQPCATGPVPPPKWPDPPRSGR
jgi:predicted DNA-binding transcriptional regulator AlpA